MSRTEYMIRSALGTMPEVESAQARRLDDLEQRVARIEHAMFEG